MKKRLLSFQFKLTFSTNDVLFITEYLWRRMYALPMMANVVPNELIICQIPTLVDGGMNVVLSYHFVWRNYITSLILIF